MFNFLWKILKALATAEVKHDTTVSSFPESQYDYVELQTQDITSNWRTMHVTRSNPQLIVSGMRQIANQFPDQRVRAIDNNGRIVDFL
jgi:hypothetical protein